MNAVPSYTWLAYATPTELKEMAERRNTHTMSEFKSDPDQPRDQIGTIDERCRNCGNIFNDHYNGQCPRENN